MLDDVFDVLDIDLRTFELDCLILDLVDDFFLDFESILCVFRNEEGERFLRNFSSNIIRRCISKILLKMHLQSF